MIRKRGSAAHAVQIGALVSADPEFDELKREFLAEADGKVREIASMLRDSTPRESRERMIYLAHQLKGAGGSYGFPSISGDAAALEIALETMDESISIDLQTEVRTRLENLGRDVEKSLKDLSV
jgi:HPt (histidine-containing phosphotransfer) domain-containing protein